MPIKIRLQRHGAKKRPFYFIVVANSRSPRDGKYIEKLGTYNPIMHPNIINIDRDKSLLWLNRGAIPTPTVKRLLSFKGVLLWKHLLRGVKLGLFDQNTAEQKYQKWIDEHNNHIEQVKGEHLQIKADLANQSKAIALEKAKAKKDVQLSESAASAPTETDISAIEENIAAES